MDFRKHEEKILEHKVFRQMYCDFLKEYCTLVLPDWYGFKNRQKIYSLAFYSL
jgi:hypothetical protein